MGNGTIYSPSPFGEGAGGGFRKGEGEAFGGIVEAISSAILDLCH